MAWGLIEVVLVGLGVFYSYSIFWKCTCFVPCSDTEVGHQRHTSLRRDLSSILIDEFLHRELNNDSIRIAASQNDSE